MTCLVLKELPSAAGNIHSSSKAGAKALKKPDVQPAGGILAAVALRV